MQARRRAPLVSHSQNLAEIIMLGQYIFLSICTSDERFFVQNVTTRVNVHSTITKIYPIFKGIVSRKFAMLLLVPLEN
jgi:hypothetical protein